VSKDPKPRAKGEQLSLPGVPLEQRQAVWRKHTAERWLRDDADAYAACVEAIKNGETNQSALAELFGVSRNTIHSLMMREFSVEQLQTINAKCAAIVAGQALGKAGEVVEKATKRELGPLAILAKTGNDIAQLNSGGATSRHEERVVFSVEDFAREVGPGTGLGEGKFEGLPAGGEVVGGALGLGEGVAVPGVREVELVPLGNNSSLTEDGVIRSGRGAMAAVVLLFVPVLGGLAGGMGWDQVDGSAGWAGFSKRGGGGRAGAGALESSIHSATRNFSALPMGDACQAGPVPWVPDGC
jgi:hypothetical protein